MALRTASRADANQPAIVAALGGWGLRRWYGPAMRRGRQAQVLGNGGVAIALAQGLADPNHFPLVGKERIPGRRFLFGGPGPQL